MVKESRQSSMHQLYEIPPYIFSAIFRSCPDVVQQISEEKRERAKDFRNYVPSLSQRFQSAIVIYSIVSHVIHTVWLFPTGDRRQKRIFSTQSKLMLTAHFCLSIAGGGPGGAGGGRIRRKMKTEGGDVWKIETEDSLRCDEVQSWCSYLIDHSTRLWLVIPANACVIKLVRTRR